MWGGFFGRACTCGSQHAWPFGLGQKRRRGGSARAGGVWAQSRAAQLTFVREHIDLERVGHISPEAENYAEVLCIRVRHKDLRGRRRRLVVNDGFLGKLGGRRGTATAHRDGVAPANMKGGNPMALVIFQPHVDVLLPVRGWRRAEGHLIHGARCHVPHWSLAPPRETTAAAAECSAELSSALSRTSLVSVHRQLPVARPRGEEGRGRGSSRPLVSFCRIRPDQLLTDDGS